MATRNRGSLGTSCTCVYVSEQELCTCAVECTSMITWAGGSQRDTQGCHQKAWQSVLVLCMYKLLGEQGLST